MHLKNEFGLFRTLISSALRFPGGTVIPRMNRTWIFADDQIQPFHPVNRCVRHTFQFARDDVTRRDDSHRKPWPRDRFDLKTTGTIALPLQSVLV